MVFVNKIFFEYLASSYKPRPDSYCKIINFLNWMKISDALIFLKLSKHGKCFSISVRNNVTKYYEIALNRGWNLLMAVTCVVQLKQNNTNFQIG